MGTDGTTWPTFAVPPSSGCSVTPSHEMIHDSVVDPDASRRLALIAEGAERRQLDECDGEQPDAA